MSVGPISFCGSFQKQFPVHFLGFCVILCSLPLKSYYLTIGEYMGDINVGHLLLNNY